jgi:CheY-like chemotaxis protein
MNDSQIDILLVEDNPTDVRLLETYFADSDAKYKLQVVETGEAALSFLYHGVEFTDAPRPDVVLLDLNLPKMTGFEVLAAVKQHDHLKDIPVIVLTGSTDDDDIKKAYSLQANCFLKKPQDPESFAALIQVVDEFWLQHAALPGR